MKRLEFVTACALVFTWILCLTRSAFLFCTELGIIAPMGWLIAAVLVTGCIVAVYLVAALVRLFLTDINKIADRD